MTGMAGESADDYVDVGADTEISECLDLKNPRSFFLFAGAGSGKTRSLVKALKGLTKRSGEGLRREARRVGVITYTNAACDEIKSRLDHDPLIVVSTIHSFVWDLIGAYTSDIRVWVASKLQIDIRELYEEQKKGKESQASIDRANEIRSKTARLERLGRVFRFTYSPTGQNTGYDALNHSEVIAMGAQFLSEKPLLQQILVSKFPVLLIDECQDTNKYLVDALFKVQEAHKSRFVLGLIGDTMQRIYFDGKPNIGQNIPADWAKPIKRMNHRCPPRVVSLINRLRSAADDQDQQPRSDRPDGHVRLFICPDALHERNGAERQVREWMAEVTNDMFWKSEHDVKTLILEHHMAARRMGFQQLFDPLYRVKKLKTGLLEGTLSSIRFFTDIVLPIVAASRRIDAQGELNPDHFAIMNVVKQHSALLDKEVLKSAQDQTSQLMQARDGVVQLLSLWNGGADPRLIDVIRTIFKSNLFPMSETLRLALERSTSQTTQADVPMDASSNAADDDPLAPWEQALKAPFSQLEKYASYISGNGPFDTHQGVKGREFSRVLVIIDDGESRSSMFQYEKLFGTKGETDTDIRNRQAGKDTSLDRVRRLFYVACSRAEKSLAVIVYSPDPLATEAHVIREGWFEKHEVRLI